MRTRTHHVGLRLVVVAAALLACMGCADEPTALPAARTSPHVGPATSETVPVSVSLPGLLPLADVERETRTIDFAALADASPLGHGWDLEPTLGQAWGTGGGSSLTFNVLPVRDLEIDIRCAPFHFRGSERQTLGVSVNGAEVASLRLWKMMRGYTVRVPADLLRFGPNLLELSYAYAAVPAEVLEDSDDGRQLAVLFEHFRFGDDADVPVPDPRASPDGTRLDLPFGARVNYYLELGSDSRLRIGGVDLWPEDARDGPEDWRLRLEAAVDGAEEVRIVELDAERLSSPLQMALPVDTTGQRARVSLAAYHAGRPSSAPTGLTIDLPEVLSADEDLARRLAEREAAGATDLPQAVRRPNVLIYMIDTLRADHLGVYGYERPTSPEIDAFAAGATLFRNAIAQSSWTKPSVATVLTGLNPQLHGVNGRKDALTRDATTLAELLWDAGYETAAIYTNGNLSHMGLGQGYHHYQHLREGTTRSIHVLSDTLNEEAYRWLDRRDRSKPFFLYLHATDPHSPYTPPEGFLERVGLEVSDPDAGLIENVKRLRRNVVDERQLADLVALYDAEIAFNDHHFGRLLRELERQGLLDSTLVVLVSDHGEEFFDHGWWQHGKTLYQEQLGVPLVIKFPGGVGAGHEVDAVAQHVDILPTVLDVTGVEIPAALPGRSLLPLVAGQRAGPPIHAISYLDLDNRTAESVTTRFGKLILHHYDVGRSRLLFDLDADPGEEDDLVEERPVLFGSLMAALRAFHLAQDVRLAPEQGEFDPELTERLKALGYLN